MNITSIQTLTVLAVPECLVEVVTKILDVFSAAYFTDQQQLLPNQFGGLKNQTPNIGSKTMLMEANTAEQN